MIEFFVSPNGDDAAPGTEVAPFASLDRARRAVQHAPGSVVVHLRAGTYQLGETLRLTDRDAHGAAGSVVFQAYGYGTGQQEPVTISGGRPITDWEQRDGVWLADIGEEDTRELYVDGHRVERAGIDGLAGTVASSATGYRTDNPEPLRWRAPGSVEFVYRGIYPWTEARCAVSAVSAVAGDERTAVIEMRQPAFEWSMALYNSAWEGATSTGPGLPSRVENDPSFLVEPGTYALDRTRRGHHVLHYLPRVGEDPATTTVTLPRLETLISVDGARGLSFRGVTFAEATWCRPHSDRGFLHYHGSGYYDGGTVEKVVIVGGESWVTVPGESETMPAAVTVEGASDVRFEGCRFTRFGASALGIRDASAVSVGGCDVDVVGGSAVQITGSRDVLVEDTVIRHIGLGYPGSPGLALLDTEGCVVAHNRIEEVPHCGIAAGPGRGTRIERNLITGAMGVLADGGGIYISSRQGDSALTGAQVAKNVVRDTRTPYNFALYADYGACWVTFEENVVSEADNTAILQVDPPLENVTFRGNLWDADPLGLETIPASVTYEGNTTITDPVALDAASAEIRKHAGPRRSADPS